MPRLRKTVSEVVGLAVADLHISSKPPAARVVEEDWLEAMARSFIQLKKLARKYHVPVLCAGDVFDRPDAPPSAISFALRFLPDWTICVPGNHDLPHHSWEERGKSALWTLVEAGKVTMLEPGKPFGAGEMQLWGWPCGFPVEPCPEPHSLALDVAVVHDYVWRKGCVHPGADEGSKASAFLSRVAGYDVAVFGDNHIPFDFHQIHNVGTFMRRKMDERQLEPSVCLIHRDGSVTRHRLDVSEDKFVDLKDWAAMVEDEHDIDLDEFIDELKKLSDAPINFREAVERALDERKCDAETRRIVMDAMEK